MSQRQASPILTASRTASLLSTGSVPGYPSVTGLICVLGSAPKVVLSEQNNFVFVRSCACTSRPMTVSYFESDIIIRFFREQRKAQRRALAAPVLCASH